MACQVTAGSGMSRGLEDALEAKVTGKCEGKKNHTYFVSKIVLTFCGKKMF